ncbi:MAG: nicotinate-nucleotide adenylyltransferase [Devosia nanyangense]|uniref:Probable nicotinate-nucleotide adenylyltransferase n=1 Tax=Devosia nanyangense TaxID=1228055 RepID=A0A933NZZ6_9HYPH|nr:nicotinate-nucleotide adenylyltransferase [Devosia nanyangense]
MPETQGAGTAGLPIAGPGLRIGLFGGSFNPAHEGHRLVALECLKRLALDKVWILVSPGNPLKDHTELAPLAERTEATRRLMNHPALEVTAFEAAHNLRYTHETLTFLTAALPAAHFVWIMGADSLMNFDRWERWEDIARLMPMAVYARPGATFRATQSRAAVALADCRIPEEAAETLAGRPPPAWVYLHGIMSPLSSTAIRQARQSSQ